MLAVITTTFSNNVTKYFLRIEYIVMTMDNTTSI